RDRRREGPVPSGPWESPLLRSNYLVAKHIPSFSPSTIPGRDSELRNCTWHVLRNQHYRDAPAPLQHAVGEISGFASLAPHPHGLCMVGGRRTACLVVVSGPGVSVPRTRAPLRRQFPPNQYTDADKESHADNQRWRERGEILQHRGHLARRS